ncbi:MAG: hypothetical protein IPM82_30995 [Saprospiraceae bacterium]|nr:hypothetical protein [Saprospiraceae bacterium]
MSTRPPQNWKHCCDLHSKATTSQSRRSGLPGIADPGAKLVELAHRRGLEVVPLGAPSSILLAPMASGRTGRDPWLSTATLSAKAPADDLKRLEQLATKAPPNATFHRNAPQEQGYHGRQSAEGVATRPKVFASPPT